MANSSASSAVFNPDLSLTPGQQDLLLTALSSNKPATSRKRSSPTGLEASSQRIQQLGDNHELTTQQNHDLPPFRNAGFDESPFLDYELDDGNFDWDNSGDQLIGQMPGFPNEENGETHEKRKSPDDDEEEDDEEDGGGKRREGGDKTMKKPGRKPLTSEPTTKRKAQNRAAQRAFRERKERHLKELEIKVEDLEKASESANHENGLLRAQVDRLATALKEYRKRMVLNTSAAGRSPPPGPTVSSQSNTNFNNNDFQFAFPKFGDLHNSPVTRVSPSRTSPITAGGAALSSNVGTIRTSSVGSNKAFTSPDQSWNSILPSTDFGTYQSPDTGLNGNGIEDLNGLFSPSILRNASRSDSTDYMSYDNGKGNNINKYGSTDSSSGQSHISSFNGGSSTSMTASPSASSVSQNGTPSSCGTTPEPSAESPKNRMASDVVLHTINEEAGIQNKSDVPFYLPKTPASDINGIDWMAQQNGGQFDPVLFGDYRDPQDSILQNNFNDFFSDAFPISDLSSPFSNGDTAPPAPKRDIIKEIEEQQSGTYDGVGPANPRQYVTCDKLWDRVQSSERVQSGEIDMDNLCSQLKSKAKCSGSGAVVDKRDIDDILGPVRESPNDFLNMFR